MLAGRAFIHPFGRVHPHFGAARTDAITITLPDVERLRDDARQKQRVGGVRGPRRGTSLAASPRKLCAHRATGAACARGHQRAVRALDEVEPVVGSHESGDECRRRPVEDLFRRAALDDASGVDDGDAVGQRQRLFAIVRHVTRR